MGWKSSRENKKDNRKITMKLKDIPAEERPREKLLREGVEALTNEELFAVILGTGTKKEDVMSISRKIISQYGNISKFSSLKAKDLMQMFELPQVKALQVLAVMELGKRLFGMHNEPILNSPDKVYEYARDMAFLKKEVVRGIYLDTRGKVVHDEVLFIGSLTEATIHPREILKPAIVHSAYSFILLHNHPSGDPTPSKKDIEITKKIKKAARIMGIELLDHIIITSSGYRSVEV